MSRTVAKFLFLRFGEREATSARVCMSYERTTPSMTICALNPVTAADLCDTDYEYNGESTIVPAPLNGSIPLQLCCCVLYRNESTDAALVERHLWLPGL